MFIHPANHERLVDCAVYFLGCLFQRQPFGSAWLAIKHPRAGRAGFALLFAAACWFNISLAREMPWLYSKNAEILTIPYDFLVGDTLGNISTQILWIMGLCQAATAVALMLKGRLFVLGCWCAMILCIALIPLGLRAAFPAPALAALALYYLQRDWQQAYARR